MAGTAGTTSQRYTNEWDPKTIDVVMPGMRGPEFVRRAGEIAPRLRVPFTTGYELKPIEGESRGPDPVLCKPYTPDQLLPRLRELLDRAA